MRILSGILLLAFLIPGCAGVEPALECESQLDTCHEGYICDDHTKTCLTYCTKDAECITKSQTCDKINFVCRTRCDTNTPCLDATHSCVHPEDASPISTEGGGDPDELGVCKSTPTPEE